MSLISSAIELPLMLGLVILSTFSLNLIALTLARVLVRKRADGALRSEIPGASP
jgi:hypothetical protein